MIEEFNVKVWRKYYDQIQILGEYLKDSYPKLDEFGNKLPPIVAITEDDQKDLIDDIDELMKRCMAYLDGCGMKAKEPKWKYIREDLRTHASSQEFEYRHLHQQVARLR